MKAGELKKRAKSGTVVTETPFKEWTDREDFGADFMVAQTKMSVTYFEERSVSQKSLAKFAKRGVCCPSALKKASCLGSGAENPSKLGIKTSGKGRTLYITPIK